MAYCATITLHDAEGQALCALRYARMPGSDPDDLCETLLIDVTNWLETRPDLCVILLADGAEENWNLLRRFFNETTLGKKPEECLDFYHAVEKLAPAAEELFGNLGTLRLGEWRSRLLHSEQAPKRIQKELTLAASEGREATREAATYFTNHFQQMPYADFKARGLPIGSGMVEATCKSLVAVRMKRSGTRWKQRTGQHLLSLRALALSSRWDQAMNKLFARSRATVRRAA